jgi:hypothetical protein
MMQVTRLLEVGVTLGLFGAIAGVARLFRKGAPLDAGAVSATWLADQERGKSGPGKTASREGPPARVNFGRLRQTTWADRSGQYRSSAATGRIRCNSHRVLCRMSVARLGY